MLLRFSLTYVLPVEALEYIFLPFLLTGLINRIILRVTPSDFKIVKVCTIKFSRSNNYKKTKQTVLPLDHSQLLVSNSRTGEKATIPSINFFLPYELGRGKHNIFLRLNGRPFFSRFSTSH